MNILPPPSPFTMKRRKRCPECKHWHSKWTECPLPTSSTGFVTWKPIASGGTLYVTPVSGPEEGEALATELLRRFPRPTEAFSHPKHLPKYVSKRPERYPKGRPRELQWVKDPLKAVPKPRARKPAPPGTFAYPRAPCRLCGNDAPSRQDGSLMNHKCPPEAPLGPPAPAET